MATLYKMFWIRYDTTFGSIWQPVKPKYGNYRSRGYSGRVRRILNLKNK